MLLEARVTAYKRIKKFQKKLMKRSSKNSLPFEIDQMVLEYKSEKENVFGDKSQAVGKDLSSSTKYYIMVLTSRKTLMERFLPIDQRIATD